MVWCGLMLNRFRARMGHEFKPIVNTSNKSEFSLLPVTEKTSNGPQKSRTSTSSNIRIPTFRVFIWTVYYSLVFQNDRILANSSPLGSGKPCPIPSYEANFTAEPNFRNVSAARCGSLEKLLSSAPCPIYTRRFRKALRGGDFSLFFGTSSRSKGAPSGAIPRKMWGYFKPNRCCVSYCFY